MQLNPLKIFNELINTHIQNIEKRQNFTLLMQFILAALSIGLCSYLIGIPFFTLLYVSSIMFSIPIDISIWVTAFSALCFAFYDLKPLYYDKIKKIDAFALSPEKIIFIKNQVAQLAKKAGISAPNIYVDENDSTLNAEFKWSLFTPGKIILTAGSLRSFGLGELSKRDIRATLAHELGHKIGKDNPMMAVLTFSIATAVGTYLTVIMAMIETSLQLMSLSLMTFTAAIPLALASVGLLIYGAISISLLLQYRKNMESAADIRGAHLTNDIEGMVKSNKHMSTRGSSLSIYTWLSLLDRPQIRKFLSLIKKISSSFQYDQFKNILTQQIPFKEKEKKLINSSFLDKEWKKKFRIPTACFEDKYFDVLAQRNQESYSMKNGYFTRFHQKMISIMNPYPSTKERNFEVRNSFRKPN